MSQPIWVPVEAVQIIHDRQIARHGGASIVMVFTIFGTDQTSAFLKNKGNDLGSIFIYTHSIRCLSGVCVYIGLVIIFGLNSE